MDSLIIEGGSRLRGSLKVNGSKNAALPLMAAALLADGPTYLKDVPNLSDINHQINLLRELGCEVERQASGELKIDVKDEKNSHARYDLVRKMRASICVLGPLLAKRKFARISMPGGCAIGDRPVDIHLRGLEALGAVIDLDGGDIIARADKLSRRGDFPGRQFRIDGSGDGECDVGGDACEGHDDDRVRGVRAGDCGCGRLFECDGGED